MFLFCPQSSIHAGTYWQQVGGNGLGDPNNTFIPTLEVWNNALYAGVGNYASGARIYRSTDGNTWTKVNLDGFGHVALTAILDFQSFDGWLYASSFDDNDPPAQTAEIWRSNDGITWTQSGNDGLGENHNTGFYEIAEFNGELYVGSRNDTDGAAIYRTADGTNWNLVADSAGGFGVPGNKIIWSLYAFDGWLWAGTFNVAGGQVWRSANGTDWDLYRDFALIDPNITAINHFFEFNNLLHWFGIDANEGATITRRTTDIVTEIFIDFTGDPRDIWYSQNAVVSGGLLYGGTRNNITGGALWYTTDGVNLTQIGLDGFGSADNFALYALAFKDYLYIGFSTTDALKGIEVWRMRTSSYSFAIITDKTLPEGTTGQSYSINLETKGGTSPYSYSVIDGSLPEGLQLDGQTGEIAGIPQKEGDYTFTIQVQDSAATPHRARKIFTLKIIAGASTSNQTLILPETGADL